MVHRPAVPIPPDMTLAPVSVSKMGQYLEMIQTARDRGEDGSGYYMINPAAAQADPAAHVRRLAAMERGENLPEGWVPMSTRWLIGAPQGDAAAKSELTAGRLVGEVRIRHALSPALEIEGGHVGYFIHPDLRGRGYGNVILALAVRELADLRVERVLVTCNADNLRSRRVIERNGGVFDRYTVSPKSGKQVMGFWIENSSFAAS